MWLKASDSGLRVDAMTMKGHGHITIEVYENGEVVHSDADNTGWAQVSYKAAETPSCLRASPRAVPERGPKKLRDGREEHEMPTLRERLGRVPAETRTGPEQVVLLVSAWEPHFLEWAMEGWAWGEHRLSEWTRANVTHVAFYRPYRAGGPAITHAAPLDRFYESRERGRWGYDLARQPEELPREIPRGEKWVQGPWLVTLESLLLARSVDDLEHPTRD